jgi:hypothetical protein
LSPTPDSPTAMAIKKQLAQLKEIRSIKVDPKDSSVRFTVKDNMQVALATLQNAVKTAAPDVNVGTPVPEQAGSSPSASPAMPDNTPATGRGGY